MASAFGDLLPLALLLVGGALCVAEAMAPGAHFIVVGVALLVAGLVGLLVPALATPFALAVLVLAVGAVTLYVYRSLDFYGGKGRARTRDSTSLAGQEGVVLQRVTTSSGRVRLDDGGFDPTYSARAFGEEIPEGARVIVIDPGGGSVLTVAALEEMDDIDRELARHRDREADADSEFESA